MPQSDRTALDILAKADIDPIIAEELLEDTLGGYWEEAIEKIKDELKVDQLEAELVYDHIRSVSVGTPIDLVEVSVDNVEFKTFEERSGPGNPFVLWTAYFVRRGSRVKSAVPVLKRDGGRAFIFNGETIQAEAFDQIWKSVPRA